MTGATLNPWDTARTVGGSSWRSGGGALTAGLTPLLIAQGSDGGAGSIRIPACRLRVLWLKPSRGRISNAPFRSRHRPLDDSASLARNVADAAAYSRGRRLRVGRPVVATPRRSGPFAEAVERASRRLRIAVTTVPPGEAADVHADCRAAAEDAAALLAALGHVDVEERLRPI